MHQKLIDSLLAKGFYLGGSRRMAERFPHYIKVGADADYDFYGQSNTANLTFLLQNQFQDMGGAGYYFDDLLTNIFVHQEYDIQVLLRTDAELYRKCFESVSPGLFKEKLWKSSPLRNKDLSDDEFKYNVRNYFNSLFELYKKN